MARTKGSKDTKPRKPRSDKKEAPVAAAGPGHNSKEQVPQLRVDDQAQQVAFIEGLYKIEQMEAAKKQISDDIKKFKQTTMWGKGFTKEDIDFGLALRAGDEKAITTRRRREQQIAVWLNHPIAQMDLFDQNATHEHIDRTPLVEKANKEGLRAGAEGKDCRAPESYTGEVYTAWINAWHEAQAHLMKGIKDGGVDLIPKPPHKPEETSFDDALGDAETESDAPKSVFAEAAAEGDALIEEAEEQLNGPKSASERAADAERQLFAN